MNYDLKKIDQIFRDPNKKITFLGYNDLNKSEEFWKELNEYFRFREKLELFLYDVVGYQGKLDFLKYLQNVRKLKLSNLQNIDGVKHLKSLSSLDIWDCPSSLDFNFSQNTKLERLYLSCLLYTSPSPRD